MQNQSEVKALFKEMLIDVTRFSRDPEAFQVLKEKALPDLIQAQPDDYTLRAWVVGCSTGQEAYSIAMVLQAPGDRPRPA